jgi:hypothetical protein
MYIYIHQVRFPDEKEVTVSVSASATSDALKSQIREATGTHEAYQRLIFQGKLLEGGHVLKDSKMTNGCVVLCQVGSSLFFVPVRTDVWLCIYICTYMHT